MMWPLAPLNASRVDWDQEIMLLESGGKQVIRHE